MLCLGTIAVGPEHKREEALDLGVKRLDRTGNILLVLHTSRPF